MPSSPCFLDLHRPCRDHEVTGGGFEACSIGFISGPLRCTQSAPISYRTHRCVVCMPLRAAYWLHAATIRTMRSRRATKCQPYKRPVAAITRVADGSSPVESGCALVPTWTASGASQRLPRLPANARCEPVTEPWKHLREVPARNERGPGPCSAIDGRASRLRENGTASRPNTQGPGALFLHDIKERIR